MNIGILEPLDFSTIALQKLSKIGAIENYNGENLENFLSNKDIIFVRLNFDINQELLKSALAFAKTLVAAFKFDNDETVVAAVLPNLLTSLLRFFHVAC